MGEHPLGKKTLDGHQQKTRFMYEKKKIDKKNSKIRNQEK